MGYNSAYAQACTNSYEPNQSSASATNVFPNLGKSSFTSSVKSRITFDDQDWYLLGVDLTGNLTITLGDLPADFDIELYGINGLSGPLLGKGYNRGTTSEQFSYSYSSLQSTALYIKIYGYNLANSSACYTLTVKWEPTCPLTGITPSLITPGVPSSSGTEISTLTPTLDWANVTDATSYDVFVRDIEANDLVMNLSCPTSISQYTVPSGILKSGKLYRWNMRANIDCGSCISNIPAPIYFRTKEGCTAPSSQVSDIYFTGIGETKITVHWSRGNGGKTVVVVNKENDFMPPQNGNDPSASAQYTSSNEQVIYNGTSTSVTVTGLQALTKYYFRAYETNCTGNQILYNTVDAAGNPNSASTTSGECIPPTTPNIVSEGPWCEGQTASIEIQASGSGLEYKWLKKGDGEDFSTVGDNSPIFSTTTEGVYKCEISNECGEKESNEVSVIFNSCEGPVAEFSATKRNITAGESTTLLDQSLNASNASRSWLIERQQVNDKTTIYATFSELNPAFTLPYPGCYKVTLSLDNGPDESSLSKPCFINVSPNTSIPVNQFVALDRNYPTGYEGDPVNAATGAFAFSMKDISVFSMGREIAVERRYVSTNQAIGSFGKGWFFEYDMKLNLSNPYQWELIHGDGHITYHIPYSDGETKSLYPGMLDSLYYINQDGDFSYVFQKKTGEKYFFKTNGSLDRIVDLNKNTIQCEYSNSFRLSKIIAPGGRELTISTNSNKRIVQITDGIGRAAHYFYSGASDVQLDSARTETSTTSFRYNAIGLTEIFDPNGNPVVRTQFHPTTKKAIRQYDAFDIPTAFDYQGNGVTVVTNVNSQHKKLTHDESFRLVRNENELGFVKAFTYAPDNQIETTVDERGNTSHFSYDGAGNLSKIVDAKSFENSITYTQFSRPEVITDPLGNKVTIIYDGAGNPIEKTLPNKGVIHYYYDERGLDTLVVDAKGNRTRKEYNSYGDLTRVAAPGGIVKVFSHDSIGRIISTKNTNGDADSIYYNHFNQVIRTVDRLGYSATFSYDKNGNLISSIDKEKNKTTYIYDAKDRLIFKNKPRNHVLSLEYDPFDRVVKKRDENGNATIFTYDAAGRLLIIADSVLGTLYTYAYDNSGNTISVADHYGRTSNIEYDNLNLPVKYINPLGYGSAAEYDAKGNIVKRTDEEGNATEYRYDAMGLQTTVIDASGDSATTEYDLNGNMVRLTDANGNTRSWTYNSADKVQTFNDGNGDYLYKYDNTGRLSEYRDRASNIFIYYHDRNNQLTKVSSQTSTFQQFTYSPNGWLTKASAPIGSISYIRNELGMPVEVTGMFNAKTFYGYDSVGNITTITYPNNKKVDYKYNSLNVSTKVTDWAKGEYLLERDVMGRLDSIVFPNLSKTTFRRDGAAWVSSLKNYSSGASPPFYVNDIIRNKLGFVIQDSGTKALTAQINFATTFASYGSDDRIKTYGDYQFEHNGNGTLIKSYSPTDSATFTYTPEGLLTSINHLGNPRSNFYDPFKNRIQKSTIQQTTRYVLDYNVTDRPLVLAELDEANRQVASNVYAPDGMLLARDSSGIWQYFHHDAYGNTIALTDQAGKITDRYTYGLFGDSYVHAGTSTQPYTFLGQYGVQRDDSMLYYIWARYYDATTGRFLSKDPYSLDIASTQGINRYSYALNNPTSFVDVNGMFVSNTSYNNDWTNALGLTLSSADLLLQSWHYSTYKHSSGVVEQALKEGRYILANGKSYSNLFKGNQYISPTQIKGSIESARFAVNLGRGLTALSIISAGTTLALSDRSNEDIARFSGALVITATAFIPGVGPLISLGLGIADSYGFFDPIYERFNK